MAVLHGCWKLNVAQARRALVGLSTLADLLSPAVTERMRAIGDDPRRAHLLAMARLDPRDRESWASDLQPSTDDFGFERSGAARLTALLATISQDVRGLGVPPAFVEDHLSAVGWAPERIDLCVRGRPVSSLFEFLSPRLGGVVQQCRPWLVGGWLDHRTALELRADLTRSTIALGQTRDERVQVLSMRTGLDVDDIGSLLRKGLTDLTLMLSEADPSSVLWIIQD